MPSTLIHSLPNSGLSREKPGPKPRSMVKLGLNNGRSISPTPSSPKISTYSIPRWSVAALLPSEEKEQVDQPSEPIVQKPASRFNFLIRNFVGSFQLAVYFLHAFVYKMLSCRPGHRGPASQAGSTVPKKVAPANPSSTSDPNGYSSFLQYIDVAPAQSGPLKVPN